MNKRINYILLVIYIISLTGCQTMKTMVEHPDYNIFDSFQSNAAAKKHMKSDLANLQNISR